MWEAQMIALNIYIGIGLLASIIVVKSVERSRLLDSELDDQIKLMGNRYWVSLIGLIVLFWLPSLLIQKKGA